MSFTDPTAYARWRDAWRQVAPEPAVLRLTNAHWIGPFDHTDYKGLDQSYGPEQTLDLTASHTGKLQRSLSWQPVPELEGAFDTPVDLADLTAGDSWSVFYLYGEIEVSEPQIVQLAVQTSEVAIAWVNGQVVLAPRIPMPAGSDPVVVWVALRPGVNRVLLKLPFSFERFTLLYRFESYGAVAGVVAALQDSVDDAPDATTRLAARYELVEVLAAADDPAGVETALEALVADPLANRWDEAWADAVRAQHTASGSFLPLHDVTQRFEPVLDVEPYERFWPQSSSPAEELLVLDVSEEEPQVEFAMSVLQGLVNRTQPRLYLLHTRYARQDREWLDELLFEGYKAREVTLAEVWDQFREEISGAIIYDGAIMDEIGEYHSDQLNQTNLLMMIGAVESGVPLTTEMAEALKLPVLFDARDRWANQYEMMRWAYVELFPRMNHKIIATNYPGIFLITDYLVQFKIFTFWFPERRLLCEENLLQGILASTPPNTPIVGWWFDWMPNPKDPAHREADAVMEGPGLLRGSYFGKVLTPSHEASNLSVHSGVRLGSWRHKEPDVPEFDPEKIYYAHVISDGDNMGEALMMRTRNLQWDKPERGSFPMGWSFAPGAAVMAPPVLNYYIRTATANDLLTGGLGIGYTIPDIYLRAYPEQRQSLYADYARLTNEALKWIDSTSLWLFQGSPEQEDRYARGSDGQLRSIFNGYGGGPEWGSVREAPNDVMAFRSVTSSMWTTPRDEIIDLMVKEIRQATASMPRPAFVWAWVLNWAWTLDKLQEVQAQLGSDYVAVRPDVLAAMARKYMRDKEDG